MALRLDPDPLSLIYDATWDLLEASERLTEMIRTRSRIKLSGDVERALPPPTEVATASLPELVLWPARVDSVPRVSSSHSKFDMYLEPRIATGDWILTRKIYPLLWELHCALVDWPVKMLALQWKDTSFVTMARVESTQIGMSEDEAKRGIRGWIAVSVLHVQFWVPMANMT